MDRVAHSRGRRRAPLAVVLLLAAVLGLPSPAGAAAPPAKGKPVKVPAVPTGVTATAVSSSAVDVSWAASSGATSYELLVDGATSVTGLTTTTYHHTALAAGRTYRYQVRARNAAGASAYSSTAAATTPSAPVPASGRVGPRAVYLAMGDSIPQGGSPLGDVTAAYPYTYAKALGSRLVSYACSGESSSTFVSGACPYPSSVKDAYSGSQLAAAESYIKSNLGNVSPVSVQLGANDLFAVTGGGCGVQSGAPAALDAYEANMRTTLGRLSSALRDSSGAVRGDLVVLDMYDPYQNDCLTHPESEQLFKDLDARLAKVAAEFGVPVVDVFATFGSGLMTQNDLVCTYTYMCASPQNVHPTRAGQDAIASRLSGTLGY